MKKVMLSAMAIMSVAALSGCVSYGNTHALVTPVGVLGYHKFKPENSSTPREINLPEQRTPDRIAATNEGEQQPDQ